MSFRDQIKQDLSDVFLNLDEFADLHRIEGKEVPVVIDSDIMAKLSKIGDNRIHGMDVVTTTSEMGLVQIAVRQNRMS